jgi:photosystem II stability/assembly factor-like uncharacterized protein
MKTFLKVLCVAAILLYSFHARAQWQVRDSGIIYGRINDFIESSGTLFVGTYNGVFASTNNGDIWASSYTGMSSPNLYIRCFGKNSAGLYAGSSTVIYFSNNNGASWSVLYNVGYVTSEFALLGDTIYAATGGGGVLMSANNGISWTPMNNGITNDTVYSIIAKGPLLFAATLADGVFVSSNSGANWTNVSNGLPPIDYRICFESDGNNLFAGYGLYGMYLSSNNGASWAHVTNGLRDSARINDIIKIGNVLLTNDNDTVYRSQDHGASWSKFNDGIALQPDGASLFQLNRFYATSSFAFCGSITFGKNKVFRRNINEVLAVNETSDNNRSFDLYPNPTTGPLDIKLPQQFGTLKSLEIYNSMGQLQYVQSDKNQVDISSVAAGLYIVVVDNEKGETLRTKVLKE